MIPRRILVVDDMECFSDTLVIALSAIPDTEVEAVSTAEEAVHKLSTSKVAALVTDLQMPCMSGWELIAFVRAQPDFSRIPIVVTSGETGADLRARVRAVGADAFFQKPFSPAAVRQIVERLLHA